MYKAKEYEIMWNIRRLKNIQIYDQVAILILVLMVTVVSLVRLSFVLFLSSLRLFK